MTASGSALLWRRARLLPWLLALFVLSGCASLLAEPRYTTAAEVLQARGEPTRRWAQSDGSSVLEYSTQPDGDSCLMVEIDAGGIVLRQWDALAPANLARVRQGMSQDDVLRLLGTQRAIQHFPASGEEVWNWQIRSNSPGVATLFNVHFSDGQMVRSSRSHIALHDGAFARDPWWPGHPWGWYGHPFHLRLYHGPFWFWY